GGRRRRARPRAARDRADPSHDAAAHRERQGAARALPRGLPRRHARRAGAPRAMKRLAPASVDPYAPGFLADPWAAYRSLHAGGFDAARDFADRLPPLFMARLLGIAESDLPFLLEQTDGLLIAFNRMLHVREYAALEPRAARTLAFLRGVAAERRRAPRDDGI